MVEVYSFMNKRNTLVFHASQVGIYIATDFLKK